MAKSTEALRNEGRLSTLEANYLDLSKNVELVMTNHLPHIQAGVDDVKDNIAKLRVDFAKYIGIGIGGIAVLEILLKFIIK